MGQPPGCFRHGSGPRSGRLCRRILRIAGKARGRSLGRDGGREFFPHPIEITFFKAAMVSSGRSLIIIWPVSGNTMRSTVLRLCASG